MLMMKMSKTTSSCLPTMNLSMLSPAWANVVDWRVIGCVSEYLSFGVDCNPTRQPWPPVEWDDNASKH
jgi:hypothetical protein